MVACCLNGWFHGRLLRLVLVLALIAPWATARASLLGAELEFTRLLAHWSDYGSPEYLQLIDEARPEIAQVGFYGAHFWSLAHTEVHGGYPANFPVRGIEELGAWFESLNGKLHDRGVKVVGHFNVEFLVGDPDGPDGPRGFFKLYRDLWDEAKLGPKPLADPLDLLEKDASGAPIRNRNYAIGGMSEYWACLRNPAWKAVLKAWVKEGIRRGVDGFMINYFYRHDCLCEHCQRAFRSYLQGRFSREELEEKLGIEELATHRFSEIVSWHPAAETTPLRLEMLRFSQVSNKEVFDEVFVRYGRSLKADLIVAQWNHLGNLSQIDGDERCLLPAELWGRDESYLWYSTGGAANFTDLAAHVLGEATLQARYIRGAFADKPFTLGKYESTRIRATISELAANGGAAMGFYANCKDPLARGEIARYYRFLAEHDAIFRGSRPAGDVVLLFPRRRVHRGDVASVAAFRRLGEALLDAHVLFDVYPDDIYPDGAPPSAREQYRSVLTVNEAMGGEPGGPPGEELREAIERLPPDRGRFEAPFTVRVSASRPVSAQQELDLHFVNYDRIEPPRGPDGAPSTGGGIQDERPRPVAGVAVDVPLPAGARLRRAEVMTPEAPAPRRLEVDEKNGRVRFVLPELLVYGLVRILHDG